MRRWLELTVAVLSLCSSVLYLGEFVTSNAVTSYLGFLGSRLAGFVSVLLLGVAVLGLVASPVVLFLLVNRHSLAGSSLGPTQTQTGEPTSSPSAGPLAEATMTDVERWGWDGKRLLRELIGLDYENLDQLTDRDEGDVMHWTPIFEEHVDTWRLLVDSQRDIIGYWHFLPLFSEDFALAKVGKLIEGDLTVDRIPPLLHGHYNIYFVTILLKVKYRKSDAKLALFNSVLNTLESLAKDGIFIDEICANAYTPAGEAVCKSFGMTPVADHISHGKIYTLRFYPFSPHSIFEGRPELNRLYNQEFNAATKKSDA